MNKQTYIQEKKWGTVNNVILTIISQVKKSDAVQSLTFRYGLFRSPVKAALSGPCLVYDGN